jgi:hypothetical protein
MAQDTDQTKGKDVGGASPTEEELASPPLDPQVAARAALLDRYLRAEPEDIAHVLRPLAALGEIVAVCESARTGREPPQPDDRRSLMADVQLSLTSVGKELRRELQPAWHDYFHGELADLVNLLDDAGGVVRLLNSSRALISRLRRSESSQAVWRDLLGEVRRGAEPELCGLRVLQLREIEESLGHEWIWRGRRLRELSGEGNFTACEEVLSFPPTRTAQLAWFIFANADFPDGYLRVGQVQFFSHRLWPEAVTSESFMAQFPDAEFPAELDEDALELIKPGDAAEAHVYARVEMVGPRAQGARNPWVHGRPPGEWARELVSSIVEAATFRIGGSSWKLLSGTLVYGGQVSDASGTFGNWGESFGFGDPDVLEENRRFTPPLYEGTGEALESLEPHFAELVAEGNAAAEDAVAEVRWYEATRRQRDPAQRVVFHVRAFERALPRTVNERWNERRQASFSRVLGTRPLRFRTVQARPRFGADHPPPPLRGARPPRTVGRP